MAYCSKCGAQVADGVNFCPVCGASLNPSVLSVSVQEIENDPEKKLLAAFSYCNVLFVIYLAIFKKHDKFLIHHANQSLVALIFAVGFSIIPFLGWILIIPLLVFVIIEIVAAATGKYTKMPLLGNINILKYKEQ